ncbi:MAG TPA: ATPase [Sphingomicrobium sp.]|nr:ATPase [Sphingomicrobium sp.]
MRLLVAAAALTLGAPAAAEVVSSSAHGFALSHSAVVPLPPQDAIRAFAEVGRWWDGSHTYSGSASNLALTLQPGACLCERLPNGGAVEHLRVVYVDPGKRLVLTGSLGPLLYEATTGVLDVQFRPLGTGSRVTLTYKVAGFATGGADQLAPAVDQVIGGLVASYVGSTRAPAPAP